MRVLIIHFVSKSVYTSLTNLLKEGDNMVVRC